jgi:DNA-damage-inducible protein D
MGLYGGMRRKDITKKKGIDEKENILDYMDGEELGANIFRATQANAKIKREGFLGQAEASNIHYEVGKKVRTTIKELGGSMPEDIPAREHIKHTKKRIKAFQEGMKQKKLQVAEKRAS